MSSWLKEFKEFATRGNVMDMAIGVIIGAAFGNVITSLVNDVLMPPIGLLAGGIDFSNLFINLTGASVETLAEAQEQNAPVIAYGLFVNSVINFLIQAWAIFVVMKVANGLHRQKNAEPETPPRLCPRCFAEIDERATRCPHCTSEL